MEPEPSRIYQCLKEVNTQIRGKGVVDASGVGEPVKLEDGVGRNHKVLDCSYCPGIEASENALSSYTPLRKGQVFSLFSHQKS